MEDFDRRAMNDLRTAITAAVLKALTTTAPMQSPRLKAAVIALLQGGEIPLTPGAQDLLKNGWLSQSLTPVLNKLVSSRQLIITGRGYCLRPSDD